MTTMASNMKMRWCSLCFWTLKLLYESRSKIAMSADMEYFHILQNTKYKYNFSKTESKFQMSSGPEMQLSLWTGGWSHWWTNPRWKNTKYKYKFKYSWSHWWTNPRWKIQNTNTNTNTNTADGQTQGGEKPNKIIWLVAAPREEKLNCAFFARWPATSSSPAAIWFSPAVFTFTFCHFHCFFCYLLSSTLLYRIWYQSCLISWSCVIHYLR